MLRNIGLTFATLAVLTAASARAADSAHEGSIVINGRGEASAAPEQVQVSVVVTSLCYDTSRGAKDANAELANRILAVLHEFTADPNDRIVAAGGVNVRQTETILDGDRTKVLCELKWHASNTLTIVASKIEGIPDLQDAILGSIDATVIDSGHVAQTYAELGQPTFRLTDKTTLSLRATAQGRAYDDARAQFDVFAAHCLFQDARLTSIAPPQYDAYARSAGDAISVGSATPIIPDDINVTANWRFEWSYTAGASCPQ